MDMVYENQENLPLPELQALPFRFDFDTFPPVRAPIRKGFAYLHFCPVIKEGIAYD